MTFLQSSSGLQLPQGRLGMPAPRPKGYAVITYRCHTCGELIDKYWETFFADDTPGKEWASTIAPAKVTPRTTTHHDWHMGAGHGE